MVMNMPLVKVKTVEEVQPGSTTALKVNGVDYALCNVDGELHCLDGICPHAGGPLGEGTLEGTTLVCPWHEWAFDCRTGVNDFDEDIQLKKYAVSVVDGSILIDVP
jgi:nitrite reductase/ring-hydroxylating ferredoxin subunit